MRTNRTTRAGYSLLEILVALAVLGIAIGAAALVGLRSEGTFRAESIRMTLDAQARKVLAKMTGELRASGSGSITALAESPAWDDAMTFDQVDAIQTGTGAIDWSTARVELRYDVGEIDDGIDNNGNGLIDEGRVVLIRNWGDPNEVETTLTRWVREYLDGEEFNGLDDNGNGLVDERGFVLERTGSTVKIRLTLERVDSDGRSATRTAETSVLLRN